MDTKKLLLQVASRIGGQQVSWPELLFFSDEASGCSLSINRTKITYWCFRISHGFSKVSVLERKGGVWSAVSVCQIIWLCMLKS